MKVIVDYRASEETFDALLKLGYEIIKTPKIETVYDAISGHPDIMFQHIVTNRGEGKIQYELKDLARNALLLDLDYFIIGEIKGDEAVHFLTAAYTGHQCWASVHGISSTEAIDKLADYAMHASSYSKAELMKMLRTMEVIVFMEDFKVKEISEVVRFDESTKTLVYKRVL